MLQFKSGVPVAGLCPEILAALDVATDIFDGHVKHCIVTSGRNGKHSTFSRHYAGLAVDLRRRHLKNLEQVKLILVDLADQLGIDFNVFLEDTHYHIQYKPQSP